MEVLQLVGPFDVAGRACLHILDDPGPLDDGIVSDGAVVASLVAHRLFRQSGKRLHQGLVLPVLGAEPGIPDGHVPERDDRPALRLVHHRDGHPYRLVLTLLDDSGSELGMVGALDLSVLVQDDAVADQVVGDIGAIGNRDMVADIAADDPAVVQSFRRLEIMKAKRLWLDGSKADKAVKRAKPYARRVERIGNQDIVPRRRAVAFRFQKPYFPIGQMPP